MVEHQLPKLGVAGSIPVSRSKLSAHIAQSVERHLGKVEVTGSIPVMGSIIIKGIQHTRISLLHKSVISYIRRNSKWQKQNSKEANPT